jgi:hypothetical protein
MQIALICEKCGNVQTSDTKDEATLVMDFRQKQMSFICQNKNCKHDNIFEFGNFEEQSKKSPLPRMRINR